MRTQAGNKLIGFIVDLRNDPGGNFDDAVKAADTFIDKGDIAIVKSRKGENTKHVAATPGDLANGQPIVALVNGGTAREAELVAGALQDSHRAVLLGTKTFGESAIETLIPLNGEGAIRLTTSRYLTPSGRTIHGKGLEPDLAVSPLKLEKLAQADRRREADLRGALKNTDKDAATPNTAAPAKEPEKPATRRARRPAEGAAGGRRHRRYGYAERRAADPGDRRTARSRPGQRPHRVALIRRHGPRGRGRVRACWDRSRARTV